MRFQEVFKRLNGREAAPEDVLRFERLTSALETTPNDAMLAVLVALDHYEKLYQKVPQEITEATRVALGTLGASVELETKKYTAKAKADLAEAVAAAATEVAEKTAAKSMWQWAAGCIAATSLVVGLFGWWMHGVGSESGYAQAMDELVDAKVAASWANTSEGRAAYEMARKGSLTALIHCSADGWVIKNGNCYPHSQDTPEGRVVKGWRLP